MSQVRLRNDTHKFTKIVDDWRATDVFPVEDTRHLRNESVTIDCEQTSCHNVFYLSHLITPVAPSLASHHSGCTDCCNSLAVYGYTTLLWGGL
jgi:hypothetical protein